MRSTLVAATAAATLVLLREPLLARLRRMTSKVKLSYFDLRGLGEPIRYILCLVGVAFEDHRFASREEFLALKPSLKFGQVPCLMVDGVELFQSVAIMRFVATYFAPYSGLYPKSATAAAQVDALLDQIKDMDIGKGVASYKRRFGIPESVLNERNAEEVFTLWKTETLPRHLSFFEAALNASETPWLCGTASPTIADIFLATQLNSYRTKWPALPPFAPKLEALVAAVYALPPVAEFVAASDKGGL